MNQIMLGAFFPFVGGTLIYLFKRGRAPFWLLILTPIAMAIGSIWAVIPDIPRIIGMYDLYLRLANDPACDIFLWHYTIDQIETDTPIYAFGSIIMAASLLYAAWKELYYCETHK